MLSIQIDTKSLELEVQQHQIVLLCKFSIMYVYIIDYVRLLVIRYSRVAVRRAFFGLVKI